MKRVLVVLVLTLAVACGSTSAAAPKLNADQLKFKLFDEFGPPAFCDPDLYPIARAGGEQTSADAAYQKIRADSDLYAAITGHENLPAPPASLDEAQKLTLYRAYKRLNAVQLTPASGGYYAFDYTVDGSYLHLVGRLTSDGTLIIVTTKAQGTRPTCPV